MWVAILRATRTTHTDWIFGLDRLLQVEFDRRGPTMWRRNGAHHQTC